MIGELKIVEIIIGRNYLKKIEITFSFEPVEDKPGYYWFNKRNFQIISKEVLERALKEYEASHKLLLPDSSL